MATSIRCNESRAAGESDPPRVRTKMALGPGTGTCCRLRALVENKDEESRAPVPISRLSPPPLPTVGMVAVPTMVSVWEVPVRLSSTTVSPTLLCS